MRPPSPSVSSVSVAVYPVPSTICVFDTCAAASGAASGVTSGVEAVCCSASPSTIIGTMASPSFAQAESAIPIARAAAAAIMYFFIFLLLSPLAAQS